MILTLFILPDAESKLRDHANAVGQTLSEYGEQLVAREIAAPSTPAGELSGPRNGVIAQSLSRSTSNTSRAIGRCPKTSLTSWR